MIISIGFNRTTIIYVSNRDRIYDYLQNWYSLILSANLIKMAQKRAKDGAVLGSKFR